MGSGFQHPVVGWIAQSQKSVTADTTLGADDQFVDATIPGSGSITITLPPLPDWPGRKYFVRVTEDDGGDSVIIAAVAGFVGAANMGAQTLTAVGGFVLVENVMGLYYRVVDVDVEGSAAMSVPVELSGFTVADRVDHLRKLAIPFLGMFVFDTVNLPALVAAANDDLGVINGSAHGTSALVLQTEDAKAATKEQFVRFQMRVPDDYIPGDNAQLVAVGEMITTATNGSAVVDLVLVRVAAPSVDINTISEVDIDFAPGNPVTCTFVLTATNLVPGEMLDGVFRIKVVDSGTGTAVIGQITSAEFQFDSQRVALPAVAENDDLGLVAGSHGTSNPTLQTSDADNVVIAQSARGHVTVPESYQPGDSVNVVINADMETTISDTTATVDLVCTRQAAPTVDIVATAAQDINSLTPADVTFALTATDIVPGEVLDFVTTIDIEDGGSGTVVTGRINDLEFQFDRA